MSGDVDAEFCAVSEVKLQYLAINFRVYIFKAAVSSTSTPNYVLSLK